jgi:hypothetical protein
VTGFERASDPRSQVVITRFECPGRLALLRVFLRHKRVKQDVRSLVPGYLGGTTLILWKQRTLLSFSLWARLDDVYGMGKVDSHILASRVPHRLGVKTSCGIYAYSGDWRQLMFGAPTVAAEPVFETSTTPRNQGDSE